jgi:hypothetical protein
MPFTNRLINTGSATGSPIDFLVVAGGGGAKYGGRPGGGGAGGLRTSYGTLSGGGCSVEEPITPTSGDVLNIVIGQGGISEGGDVIASPASDGTNSSIAGSSIESIISIGGGGGGNGGAGQSNAGRSGGSGGGKGAYGTGGVGGGASCQGYNGGSQGSYYNYGGGGGGAGEAGNTNGQCYGGDGIQNAITGSAIYYAGGGGASERLSGNVFPGGLGGGGDGKSNGTAGGNGTNGLGGGGGGSQTIGGGQGGSGVVILRMPSSEYSGISSGSRTISYVGSDVVIKFTGNGTYTVK